MLSWHHVLLTCEVKQRDWVWNLVSLGQLITIKVAPCNKTNIYMARSLIVSSSCADRSNKMSLLLQLCLHECILHHPMRIWGLYFHDLSNFLIKSFITEQITLTSNAPTQHSGVQDPDQAYQFHTDGALINLNSAPPGVMGLQIDWTLCPGSVWSFCHKQFLISQNMIYSSDVAETKGEAVFNNTSDHMPPPPLLLLREKWGENNAEFGNHRKRAQT